MCESKSCVKITRKICDFFCGFSCNQRKIFSRRGCASIFKQLHHEILHIFVWKKINKKSFTQFSRVYLWAEELQASFYNSNKKMKEIVNFFAGRRYSAVSTNEMQMMGTQKPHKSLQTKPTMERGLSVLDALFHERETGKRTRLPKSKLTSVAWERLWESHVQGLLKTSWWLGPKIKFSW